MFRHLHEIRTGRTSSISHEIIGFNSQGQVLNYAEMSTAEEICEHASKVVTFIDLAGHRKYLRTTLLGLTGTVCLFVSPNRCCSLWIFVCNNFHSIFSGYSPHHVMLVIAPPMNEAFQEHLALCLALRLPFFVVVTKRDLGFCEAQNALTELENAIRGHGCTKRPVLYSVPDDNSNTPKGYDLETIPVFHVSCVTGEGLKELTRFIRDLLPSESTPPESDPESCLFQIDETFR